MNKSQSNIKEILFLALNILFVLPKACAMNMPLAAIGVSVDSIDFRIEQTRLNQKDPNAPEATKRLEINRYKTTYLEKGINIAGISLGALGALIILIKLYVWHENTQTQKKIDHLNRIITTNSWNEEDSKLLEELYIFVCELRDHPECKEQKDKLIRVLSCFPESIKKPINKKKECSDDTEDFVKSIILNYFLWKDWF